MTAEPIRKLSYISWYDPDAWMEEMKGARWDKLLADESAHYNALTEIPVVKRLANKFKEEMEAVEPMNHIEAFTIGDGAISITLERAGKFLWRWLWSKKQHVAYDIEVVGKTVWYITTEDSGSHYRNSLVCESADCIIQWKKPTVAQQVFIRDGLCYYIKVEDYFRTIELCCCNAYTGANERILYREKDKSRDLGLVGTTGKTLYLKSMDAGTSRCWRITRDNLVPLDHDTDSQLLLGRWPDRQHGEDQRIVRMPGSYKLIPRGDFISRWDLPEGHPEYVNLLTGSVIVRNNGEDSLWFCGPGARPRRIITTPLASISANYWKVWEADVIEQFLIYSPAEPPYRVDILHGSIIAEHRPFKAAPSWAALSPLRVMKGSARSADGIHVPYAIVHSCHKSDIRGLLVYGYGAYGTPTEAGWPVSGWGPLLRRGWAIAYAFVRGGGDRDPAWTDAARLTGRHHAIEDYEAVIAAAQKTVGVDSRATVVYGRSAGGLLVGATVARHPYGDLVGAAFAEVPYVDLLRTQTNPDLPLTVGEYNEFGNPAKRVVDFAAMLKLSPVDQLGCEGAPGVFVLARTGLKDYQVYPYEPFKWIRRLRGLDAGSSAAGKFIAFEASQAHVYQGPIFAETRAKDLAILESWLRDKKNRRSEYKMAKKNNTMKRKDGGKRKMHRKGRKTHKRRQTRKN